MRAPAARLAGRGLAAAALTLAAREAAGQTPAAVDSVTRALGPRADTLVQTGVDIATPSAAIAPGTLVNPGPAPIAARGVAIALRAFGRLADPTQRVDVAFPFAECPFVLRLHRRADRTDRPAWRSDAARGALACPPPERHFPSFVAAGWDAAAVLGDSLPAGRYTLAYDVRLRDGRVLPFAAGGGYLTADPRPPVRNDAALRYRVVTAVRGAGPRDLVTTVWARNPTGRWLDFRYVDDVLRLRLFRTATHGSAPVWRSEARAAMRGYRSRLMIYGSPIPPGDSLPVELAVPLREVLSDSVRPGRYHAAVIVTLYDDGRASAARRRVVHLDAGAVDLPAGRE